MLGHSSPRIRLWKGYHSSELIELIRAAWSEGKTLILCPPMLTDFDFLPCLPAGRIELVGDGWTHSERETLTDLSRNPPETVFPVTPVLGVFTSGTVGGKPRLVLYSKACIEASLAGILEVFDRDRIDAIFCYPQPFHTFGLILGYVQAIATGRPLFTPTGKYSSTSHRAWLEAADSYPGMLTLGTPTHFQDLLGFFADRAPAEIPATYSSIIGGAPVPRELWRGLRDRLRIAAPSIGYGCTEASPGLTHLPPGVEPSENGEIGGVLRGIHLEILPGMGLEFSGPQTCLAVIQDGEIGFPKRVLIRDRIVRRSENRLVFQGRYDLIFNRGGMKFSLEEIELHLRETFPTSDFLCVAVHDERLGEDLGILARPGNPPSEAFRKAISAALQVRFLAHFNPARIVWVSNLPVNAAAKPDRDAGARVVATRAAEYHPHPR